MERCCFFIYGYAFYILAWLKQVNALTFSVFNGTILFYTDIIKVDEH